MYEYSLIYILHLMFYGDDALLYFLFLKMHVCVTQIRILKWHYAPVSINGV